MLFINTDCPHPLVKLPKKCYDILVMLFFNIPDIFNLGDTFRQKFDSHYTRNIGRDSRNSVLLEPLEAALTNLLDIRERVGSRIEKETASGTDMTNVLVALDAADRSLSSAEEQVAIATSTASGANPRPAYWDVQTAYTSLGQTRDSLNTVVTTIEAAVEQASTTAAMNASSNHKSTRTKNVKK